MKRPFSFVEVPPERGVAKPRTGGLTMMIDAGIPLGYQTDIMEVAGNYCDLAKFKTGTSRLYDEPYLRRKIACYLRHKVKPFIGGQFHEYVFATQGERGLPAFYKEAWRIGFKALEISDNVVTLTARQRRDQIRNARNAGFEVFGEVGAKDRRSEPGELITQAHECFAAGASLVLVEAAELIIDGRPNRAMLKKLADGLDMGRMMIELPGSWISGVRSCDVEDLKKFLIREYGPNVNLANVAPETLIDLEASRTGLGVAGPPGKARRVHSRTR